MICTFLFTQFNFSFFLITIIILLLMSTKTFLIFNVITLLFFFFKGNLKMNCKQKRRDGEAREKCGEQK